MLTRYDVPLAPYTTLRLGGPARVLFEARSDDDVVQVLREHPEAFVLGGGSNVVLPDEGLPEVLLVRTQGVQVTAKGLQVQAGQSWDQLVQQSLELGFVGLEALSGIPGSVGAAPVQNIGAYGAELAQVVESLTVLDRRTGQVEVLPAAACGFGYRHSTFKAQPNRWVVLSVQLHLQRGALGASVQYAELARSLGVAVGERAPAAQVREQVLALRRGKGMVLDPADPDSVSAGSFFTNPLVATAPIGAPSWPDPSGMVKVSAAWLIEQSGFGKGWGDGQIGLSTKHSLALVNRGGGTAAELSSVVAVLIEGVRGHFGITLVPEPVVVDATPR